MKRFRNKISAPYIDCSLGLPQRVSESPSILCDLFYLPINDDVKYFYNEESFVLSKVELKFIVVIVIAETETKMIHILSRDKVVLLL